jgi:hypothetical protein
VLGPPRFEDPEQTRVATLLNGLQLFLFAGTILWTILLIIAPERIFVLSIDIMFAVAVLTSWAFTRVGKLRVASMILVAGLWVATFMALSTQGLGSPYVGTLFLVSCKQQHT